MSSETRLIRARSSAEPTPLRLQFDPSVEREQLVVRVTATKGCAFRTEVTQKRERVIKRHANSTVMGIETSVVAISALFFVLGVAVIAVTASSHSHENDCGASVLGCSSPAGGLFAGFGATGLLYGLPVLAIDGVRQLDSTESMPDGHLVSEAVQIQACGTAPWARSEVEVRSGGPSGKAQTDERGEARFPYAAGWTGPVVLVINGQVAYTFSL